MSTHDRIKGAAAVLIAAAVIGTSVGCAPGGAPGGGDNGAEEGGPVTIEWWDYYQPGTSDDALTAQLDEYEELNTDVTIERRFIAYDDLKQSLLQSAGAADLPDVVVINGPDHQQFAELGIAVDLTDRLEEWGELELYVPGPIEGASLDGQIYGLPITANTLSLFYNVEMLEEAGVEPPTTWEELREAAAELTEDGRYGYAYSAVNNQQAVFQWLPTLWQAGGDLTDLAAPEAAEALEFHASLMQDGSVSEEALGWDQAQVAAEFAEGRAAMMINGPWQIPYLAANAPDVEYGVSLLPSDQEEASALGGENYMLITGDEEDESWELLKWLQTPERIQELAEGTGSLPTRTDVDPAIDSEVFQTFAEQLQVARPRAYGANYAEIADAVTAAIQSVLSGQQSAEEALATAAEIAEPLLP